MRPLKALLAASIIASLCVITLDEHLALASSIVDIPGPTGSENFAQHVEILDNGNFVVIDDMWDSPTKTDVGAVYLYDGNTLGLISTLTGSNTSDEVGSDGILRLEGSSNFVVLSDVWNNVGADNAGAATFVNGTTGLNGAVTPANSLVGTVTNNRVGSFAVALTNGNYVVASPEWDTGAPVDIGAATLAFADGTSTGPVTAANSIVGAGINDGFNMSITALTNGNYVISNQDFGATDVGAVTWASGTARTPIGAIGIGKSLTGTNPGDAVGAGFGGVVPLSNGNYVVVSHHWKNGLNTHAGAVTFAIGTATTNTSVSTLNSIIGSSPNDGDSLTAFALTNGHYVVTNGTWDGVAVDTGAATWGDGVTGSVHGPVGPGISLVGSTVDDGVGRNGIVPLANGNYVVLSTDWNNVSAVAPEAGAVTWGNGSTAGPRLIGAVTQSNSLVGSSPSDSVGGNSVYTLDNGNYVVSSGGWDNAGATDAGAVTWGNGVGGTSGPVSPANSLVGTQSDDAVGAWATVPLTNGNYVVASAAWTNGTAARAGAVTWVNGTSGLPVGPVDPSNSLVGTRTDDFVGTDFFGGAITALTNGNYVVASHNWANDTQLRAGAVTWGNGSGGTVGPVTTSNSLVGTRLDDHVGYHRASALTNGNYVVGSPLWNRGAIFDAGATTWGSGVGGTVGTVTPQNSLVGSTAQDHVGERVSRRPNGGYVSFDSEWDTDGIIDAGAVTYASGNVQGGLVGPITAAHAVIGAQSNDLDDVIGEGSTGVIANGSILVARHTRQIVTAFFADITPPVFPVQPPDVVVVATAGASSAVATFPTPIATDASGTPSVVCAPPSGSSFPLGDTLVTCTATDAEGLTATTTFTVSVQAGTDYIPLSPSRLADSRPAHTTIDGLYAGTGPLDVGATLDLAVAGRGGVPSDAVAATLNVTVTEPTAPGFATVYPCGEERPTASNVNFDAGATVPNAVIAKLGDTGANKGHVCIYASQPLHLVVDVNGAFPPTTSYKAINPARVIDTRESHTTVDGQQQGTGSVGDASVTAIQITGRAGVPADATAVALNVTVTEPTLAGYATVYPCGGQPPTASNLNYTPGLTVPNLVVSKIGDNGTVCVFAQSSLHLVADVNGYFPAATTFSALLPARLLDSRPNQPTVDGQSAGAGVRPLGSVTVVRVAGRGGVPANAATAVLNVTVTEPAAAGFVTVYPCGITQPLASNLNFTTGQTVPNAVISKIGTDGDVCLFTSQDTHLVVDVTGYFP